MKRMFGSCTILLVTLAAGTQTIASAQETPGMEGAWISNVTAVDCQTGAFITSTARLLYLFNHDGSVTDVSAYVAPVTGPRLSAGLGTWRHAQSQTYDFKLRLWVYNPDNSIALMAVFTKTIELNGDIFTSKGVRQNFDVNGTLVSQSCLTELATRAR
jgi:hypothetical protein